MNDNNIETTPWAVAIVVVVFDESHGQQIKTVYPPNSVSDNVLSDIKMLSMPDCLQAGSKHKFQYLLRVREKQLEFKHHCLNCFVSFSQSRDASTKRGFFQRSIVLVCKHPFAALAYRILDRLTGVVEHLPQKSVVCNSGDSNGLRPPVSIELYDSNLYASIEVAYEHFLSWPYPTGGEHLELPFYGDIISFIVPSLMTYVDYGIEPPSRARDPSISNRVDDGLGGGSGLFGDENLLSLLKPLGLLPHVWTLWELVVTGRDILVWAPSAELSSRVVTALVSLSAPLSYGGDFRPYISPYDSDVTLLSAASARKYEMDDAQVSGGSPGALLSCGAGASVGAVVSPTSSFGSDSGMIFDVVESLYDRTPPSASAPILSSGATHRPGTLDVTASSEGFDELHDMTVGYAGTTAGVSSDEQPQFTRATSENSVTGRCVSGSSLGTCVTGSTYPAGVRPPGMIVGITNPFLLKSFAHFDACIFLPVIQSKAGSGGASPFSKVRGRKMSLFSSRSSTRETTSEDGPDMSTSVSTSSTTTSLSITLPPDIPDTPVPDLPCSVSRLSRQTSLEVVHDRWMASGGAGTSGGSGANTMLCIRHSLSVRPDSRILQLVNSPAIEDILATQSSVSSSTSMFSMLGSILGEEETPSLQGSDRQAIIGNMLLREHFRHLTYALMKPFESHFQARSDLHTSMPAAASSISGSFWRADGGSPASKSPPRGEPSATSMGHSEDSTGATSGSRVSVLAKELSSTSRAPSPLRKGASSLWLYRNPNELLGGDSFAASVKKYRKNARHIPDCFVSSKRQDLFMGFAESDTFQNYYRWRKKHLSVQLFMEMALACSSLTADELIEQFAIEKGSDIITKVQMKELMNRISLYIRTMSNVNSSLASTEKIIERMKDHLNAISSFVK
mmetsp:Transcript_2872/g.4372  ORF Transcript_2872/g.4372 Transcript_2872/m.4372 type:complete len:903 (-) Transcript_2872:40-2748(-)